MGGNPSRGDGGRDCTETHHGGAQISGTVAAGGISNVPVAAVKEASAHNDGEDSEVELKDGDQMYGQGNGNWE
jgi:hypothetical protein